MPSIPMTPLLLNIPDDSLPTFPLSDRNYHTSEDDNANDFDLEEKSLIPRADQWIWDYWQRALSGA